MRITKPLLSSILALSLFAPIASAEGDDTSDVVVNTENATINVSDTIVINGDVYINGTILKSINNKLPEAYFRPKLSDVGYISEKVRKELGKGAVYEGEFDLEPVDQGFVNSREYEILGRDIILKKETYNNGVYEAQEMSRLGVTRQNGVMAIYKAIGDSQYDVKLIPRDTPDKTINDSPLLEIVQTPAVKIYGKGYYTDVFVTRTTPTKYWNNAIEDGLILKGEGPLYPSQQLTVGEFSQLLAALMHVKGEPVITKQEEEILLTTYRGKIPYYLPGSQLEAVKYLMARGIIDDSLNFKTYITRDQMLEVLMRAKDVKSRLTFKEVSIPYIDSLVEGGYYPTETIIENTPITNVSWDTETTSVQDYYDYYVKVVETDTENSLSTIFRTKLGNPTYNLYVSSTYNDTPSKPYPGSEYLGIENGYYHFKVPIAILKDKKAIRCVDPESKKDLPNESCYYDPKGDSGKAYLTINSSSVSDAPANIKLEYGGGLYLQAAPEFLSPNIPSDNTYIMDRQEFTPDYSDVLVDRERKIKSQSNITKPVPLSSSSSKAVLTFQSEDISKLLWDGKPLSQSKVFGKTNDDKVYTITLESSDPYREVMRMLTTTRTDSTVATSAPAYVKDDRTALVSLDYLKRNGVIDSVLPLSKGKCPTNTTETQCGTFMLYSKYSNILVDTVNRIIVSGQSVTEISSDDPSPLIIVEPNSGQYLIDARAVQGIGSELFVVKSESGHVSVSLNTDNKNAPGYKWKSIYPMLGNDASNYIKMSDKSGKTRIYLDDSYPLSNFLVYRSRNSSVNEDFLIVFRPKIQNVNDKVSSNIKQQLKSRFHIELGDAEVASIYPLNSKAVYQEKTQKPDSINSDDYGYYLEPTTLEKFNYIAYIKGTAKDQVLPIVEHSSGSNHKLLDLNLNIVSGYYTQYPASMLNPAVSKFLNVSTDSVTFQSGGGWKRGKTFGIVDKSIIAAPAGVQAKYYPSNPIRWVDANAKGSVYYGTMRSEIKRKTDQYSTNYVLSSGGGSITAKIPEAMISTATPFYEVFKGSQKSILVYDIPGKSRLLDFVETDASGGSPDFILTQGSKNLFDWLAYRYKNSLEDTDDIMTIIILFLLTVVPRIMLFILIGFSTLVLVKDQRIIQQLCDKWIDIYKITSFGITNVNAVSIRGIWISGFFAIVLLAMLNSGQILEVFAWVTRAMVGILNR